jgi:DNA-binding CsgD family transcriptional regulator/N-acetylneuraminic acid mutarotase
MTESNEPLSEREIEILRLVATGAANKEIALRLSISPNTVKVHLRNIFTKIDVASRTEATLYAINNGIVTQQNQVIDPDGGFAVHTPSEIGNPLALIPDTPLTIPGRLVNLRSPLLWFLLVIILLLISGLIAAPFLIPTLQPTEIPAQQIVVPSRWSTSIALPEPRAGIGAATYSGNFYLIGGQTATGISNDVIMFDPPQQNWFSMTGKPTAVVDIQAALLGERIYVPGGKVGQNQVTGKLEVFDPRQNAWESHAALPTPVSAYAMTAYEGKLYLFGGWDGQKYVKSVYRYDPELDRWDRQSDLPEVRGFSAAVSQEGRIIILGGRNDQSALSSVLVYYPNRDVEEENPWESAPDLPEPRYGLTALALANSVYVFGGTADADMKTTASPLALNPGDETWQAIDAPKTAEGNQAVVLPEGNFLHILGGSTASGLSSRHLVYQALYTVAIPLLSNQSDPNPTPTPR